MAAYRYTAKPRMKSAWRVSGFWFLDRGMGILPMICVSRASCPCGTGWEARDTEFMGRDAHATAQKRETRNQKPQTRNALRALRAAECHACLVQWHRPRSRPR
jgi:hypothetical protein